MFQRLLSSWRNVKKKEKRNIETKVGKRKEEKSIKRKQKGEVKKGKVGGFNVRQKTRWIQNKKK